MRRLNRIKRPVKSPKNNSIIDRILLNLYDSVDYGFSYRVKKGLYIDDLFHNSRWKKFDKKQLHKSLGNLKRSNFIIEKEDYDGSVIVLLSDKGKLRALDLRFKQLKSKKGDWDGKWRMVFFDIPEKCRKGRDAIRYRLKMAEFYELRESVFIFPYDCEKEIRDFIKLFKLEKYIWFGVLDFIDGGEYIAGLFKLK